MTHNIHIQPCAKSKVGNIDFDDIPLGKHFTDHMFMCDFENGQWINPRIVPLNLIPTHPAAMALHYGQAIFEGMKAYKDSNDVAMLFRPYENAKRLNLSAARLGMPDFPEDLFVEALKQFVLLEQAWIPSNHGSALYLRPFMYADEPFIGMRAASTYKFVIIGSPSGRMFRRKIKLFAETKYIRAADGGTGEAKAAGNYAAAIHPTEMAKAKGYDQVLWLDAQDFNYIQEVGTMNIFFKIGGEFITPSLDGSILAGITRDSVIKILRVEGYKVTERPVSIEEIMRANAKGQLEEAFGTGTAISITMIEEIAYKTNKILLPKSAEVGNMVLNKLEGIKTGSIDDQFNWMVKIQNQMA